MDLAKLVSVMWFIGFGLSGTFVIIGYVIGLGESLFDNVRR